MLINLHVAQAIVVLASMLALGLAVPEGLKRVIRPWQILLPPALAALAAFVQIIYPALKDLEQPEIWQFAVIAGVVGLVRGQFMAMEVDQFWHRMRLPRGGDGMLAAVALLLIALIGGVEALVVGTNRNPENPGIRLLIEIAMAGVAGFLVGRAGTAWFRIAHTPHQDLVQDTP